MVVACGNSFKPTKMKDNKQLRVFSQRNTGIFTNHRDIPLTKQMLEDMNPPE